MEFSVTIIGSGSALPTTYANQSAQVVQMGNEVFLLDCGEATQINLRHRKVKLQKISHIFISHLHGDHYFGLVGLLSSLRLLGREKPMNIYAPKGLQEIIELQFKCAGSDFSFPIYFHEVTKAGQLLLETERLKVSTIPLKHRIKCYGFKFEEKEKPRKLIPKLLEHYQIPTYARHALTLGEDYISKVDGKVIKNETLTKDPEEPKAYAYCSDTAYYEGLLSYIQGVDLLYHEATFLEKDKERAKKTYHSTASQAAKIAQQAEVKQLIIGHFSSRYSDRQPFLEESKVVFEQVKIAAEGEVFYP